MVLVPDSELGFWIGDNTSELITLSPGQLNGFPLGVLALGGNDTIQGSSDSELIIANQNDDFVLGGGGSDTIFGGKDNDSLDGQSGNDALFGNLGQDTILGGDGDDSLFGGQQNDSLIGGSGNDTIYGDLGSDTLTGGLGADLFGLRVNGQGTDLITDFQAGVDVMQLPDGIGTIEIQANGSNQTAITLANTGETLVILDGVQPSAITDDDFLGIQVSASSQPPNELDELAFIDRVVELTNAFRTENGLSPLTLNPLLTTAADNHSQNMAILDFFDHTGADGSNIGDRVAATGYNYSRAGENIAAGYTTPEDVVQGWIDSPGHRANLLNSDFTEIGVGYHFLENDTGSVNYNHYWTQVFGTPLS